MSRKAGNRNSVAERNRYSGYREYVDGNVVRKTYAEPDREVKIRRERQEKIRRRNREIRRNQENALRMDLPYLIVLTVATIAALLICCSYIRVQSSITASMRNIEKQEKALETIKNENDALQTSINTDVDLEHIYDVATNQLGMVYASKGQVIKYKKTESEYVRQYEDIPGKSGK